MLTHLQAIYVKRKYSITWMLCMPRLKKHGPDWEWFPCSWGLQAGVHRQGCLGSETFQAKGAPRAKLPPTGGVGFSYLPAVDYIGRSKSPTVDEGVQPLVLFSPGALSDLEYTWQLQSQLLLWVSCKTPPSSFCFVFCLTDCASVSTWTVNPSSSGL